MIQDQSMFKKGLESAKKRDYPEAIRYFDKAIESNPKDADAFSERGVCRFHVKDLDGALDDMNASLELDPNNAYRYASRAYIREQGGDTHGAIEDYKKAIELDPENAVSHNNLGLLEEKLGYMQQARTRFKLADELADDPKLIREEIQSEFHRDQIVKDLLEELNISTQQEERETYWNYIRSLFISSQRRRDYFRFLRDIFRKS